ncbi:PREDICTED: chromosome transmission fidelity protein 18 homolog isoform X1 [Thamnophis sirtalis]|uniref:Chromosome transmission fidelity protein 18 homolog n=2 Tax=Thamnophis sirtalis TaxID=35019 RepID=A0A6I9Y1Q0_9SAUR|nr:PREDICTED: chromosome transmission fidelity protein 18 homolog isoform X1 [Thamnophis sirtalis]
MEDDGRELYGIEDEFEAQFADELEVLAELEGPTLQVRCNKVSEFHSQKRTFEEALSAGDLVKDLHFSLEKNGPDQDPPKKMLGEGKPKCEGPKHPPTITEMVEDRLIQKFSTAHTPKPKRRRLEAVKRLDFGQLNRIVSEDSPQDSSAPTLSPNDLSAYLDERNPRPDVADQGEISDIILLHVTPPGKKESGKILKRPPILQDYINVTSTNGTRVFMVVREDGMAMEFASSVSWKRQRPLHLLGVPFAYLKEKVMEERQKQILESSEQLMEVLNRLGADEIQDEAPGPNGEEESGDRSEAEASAQHTLWVDQFTPRRYVELLSDDYTNRCLLKWLKLWDVLVFGKEKPCRKAPLHSGTHLPFKPSKDQVTRWKTKAQVTEEVLESELDQHNRPKCKIALLCGPPGLGKTTLAHVIAKHAGYNVVEMNASDDRSPDIFQTQIEAATQMKSVLGANEKPNCLVIDEIDGAPMASINVLLSIINQKAGMAESEDRPSGAKSKRQSGLLLRPIICICNDQYVPALRLLKQQAFLLHFPLTLQSRLVQRLHEIAILQGMKADIGALTTLCEKTDNDIRSCINTLQFLYSRGKKELNVRTVQTATVGLKDRNKGLFSIWQEIFQLPKVRRKNLGTDSSLPASLLLSGADDDFGRDAGQTAISSSTQQFHRILHLSVSSGEYEKLSQGLYDNFLNMKVKDSSLDSVCLALEWLGFSDLLGKAILCSQSFQLMRYLPFLPVSFHVLFAASSIPRLTYPHSQHEALSKLTQMHHLVDSMISGIAPNSRSRVRPQSFTLEALCLLLEIISPKLRPVNTQLYSQKEKEQLSQLINIMLTYNLTYHQERTPEGQYIYKLDPNVEEVCRFPDLPFRKPLTYQAKQLIAREIQVEKMRQMEAPRQALEARSLPTEASRETGTGGECRKSRIRNHEQSLDQIVKRATVEEKPERDFFGQVILKKKAAPSPEADQVLDKNTVEKQIGKAVGQSDVWFRFNEGVSNAVRRNIYIKDLF